MAKRELIDRKQAVEVVSNGFDRWHMVNLLASQESIPTITEQEIVKPYLEKIRAEIEEINVGITPLVNVYKVLDIIDKYKAESEDKE